MLSLLGTISVFAEDDTVVKVSVHTGGIRILKLDSLEGGYTSIEIDDVSNLYGASIDFHYDPSLIEIIEVVDMTAYGSASSDFDIFESNIDNINGTVTVTMTKVGQVAGLDGDMTLCAFKWKPLKEGEIEYIITDDKDKVDVLGPNICVNLVDNSDVFSPIQAGEAAIPYESTGNKIHIVDEDETLVAGEVRNIYEDESNYIITSLENVSVKLLKNGVEIFSTLTDEDGFYEIPIMDNISYGEKYTFVFSKQGYEDVVYDKALYENVLTYAFAELDNALVYNQKFDVDVNGIIDIYDIVWVAKNVGNTYRPELDFIKDNVIDIKDVNEIVKYYNLKSE